MKIKNFVLISFILSVSVLLSQTEINQYDSDGKRHGIWKKYFENTKQLRYEGEFKHGKEIGVFKFYCLECKDQPSIVKVYNDNNAIADVKFFTKKGKLVSEGKMNGKKHIGEWLYYHKKSDAVMTKENYVDGELDGLKTVYYPNGKVAEEQQYVKGERDGENNIYSPEGVLLKKLFYKKNKLDGNAVYYDAFGKVILEGTYKNDKKYGVWKSYEKGKLVKEETFPKKYKKQKKK